MTQADRIDRPTVDREGLQRALEAKIEDWRKLLRSSPTLLEAEIARLKGRLADLEEWRNAMAEDADHVAEKLGQLGNEGQQK